MKYYNNPIEGDSSPWGKIQHAVPIVDGITLVSTASHGGLLLSRDKYLAMSSTAKKARFGVNQTAAYEEDCSYCAVVLSYPEYFKPHQVTQAQKTWDAFYKKELGDFKTRLH